MIDENLIKEVDEAINNISTYDDLNDFRFLVKRGALHHFQVR